MAKKDKNKEFTWLFGDPVHLEDKEKFTNAETGRSTGRECLDEQVERIVEGATLEELLARVRPEIEIEENQRGRFALVKLGDNVWQARYDTYKLTTFTGYNCGFQTFSVEYDNAPDPRLAIYRLIEKTKKYK